MRRVEKPPGSQRGNSRKVRPRWVSQDNKTEEPGRFRENGRMARSARDAEMVPLEFVSDGGRVRYDGKGE